MKSENYIIKNTPPTDFYIYERAKKQFGVNFYEGIVFTVGQNIHSILDLTPDLIVHEQTHIRQQLFYGIEKWWDRYFIDNQFRFEQELEAYRAQYKFIKKHTQNRFIVFKHLQNSAFCLSGKMYGNICDFNKAFLLIK